MIKKVNRRDFLKYASIAPVSATFFSSFSSNSQKSYDPVKGFDPRIEVELNSIAWNLSQIRKCVGNRPVMAVIKGNAYGHGLVEVARFLEKQNVHFFAVGNFQEAIKLRENNIRIPILNLGPFPLNRAEQIVSKNISQSIYTDDMAALARAAARLNKKAKVHLKIDTGLGRVGVPYFQALPFIKKVAALKKIAIEGIFTTFTEDKEFDKIQLNRFLQICNKTKKCGINTGLRHCVSSAGILSFPQAYLDMVRPGITIYGHYPSEKEYHNRKIDLKPVLALKARVMYVKMIRPGDSVAYHRKFISKRETKVATIPIGYSDGYPYQIAGKGEAVISGKRWPIIASITANHTTLNVTGAKNLNIGDEVVLIGRQKKSSVAAEEVAAWAGTSVYKILMYMNPFIQRIYKM